MTVTVKLFLLVLALVLFLLAGLNVPTPPRFNLGWLGMFFYVLSIILA